jgi:hypothetical protein
MNFKVSVEIRKEKEKLQCWHYSPESQSSHLGPWKSFYSGAKFLSRFEEQRTPETAISGHGGACRQRGRAGEHPGARANPSVVIACPETACGVLPMCAGELQRRTWRHGALQRVADKKERPVSITRSQGSYRNKRESERSSVEVQPRWRCSWWPW